jgi:dynein heavy chain
MKIFFFRQGQELLATNELAKARQNGGWVLLQNIHLTIDWTTYTLDKIVDKLEEECHPNFRFVNFTTDIFECF